MLSITGISLILDIFYLHNSASPFIISKYPISLSL